MKLHSSDTRKNSQPKPRPTILKTAWINTCSKSHFAHTHTSSVSTKILKVSQLLQSVQVWQTDSRKVTTKNLSMLDKTVTKWKFTHCNDDDALLKSTLNVCFCHNEACTNLQYGWSGFTAGCSSLCHYWSQFHLDISACEQWQEKMNKHYLATCAIADLREGPLKGPPFWRRNLINIHHTFSSFWTVTYLSTLSTKVSPTPHRFARQSKTGRAAIRSVTGRHDFIGHE